MADVTDLLKRVQQAQMQYYQTLGNAAVDYWRSVFEVLGSLRSTQPTATPPRDVRPPAAPPPGAPSTQPATISLVLEAGAGEPAEGMFVVGNKLKQAISAPVVVSDFAHTDGRSLRPEVVVSPAIVVLEPGAQQVVRVTVIVPSDLDPDVDYRGYATVPGSSEGRVPLVLRRRADGKPTS